MMQFAFCPSPPDISPFVLGFAERRDVEPLGQALELPLASPLLQFILRGHYSVRRLSSVGSSETAPDVALWGSTGSALSGSHTEPLHVFVVILTNRGVTSLARVWPGEIADRRIAFDALWPKEASVVEELRAADSFSARVNTATAWLRALRRPSRIKDWLVLELADQIVSGDVRGAVGQIAALAGVSPRTLHRSFDRAIGCTPKASLRMARFQRALRQLHPRPWRGQAHDDALLEYFDQSHFLRDFVQMASVSPRQYLMAKRRVGDRLVNTVYGL